MTKSSRPAKKATVTNREIKDSVEELKISLPRQKKSRFYYQFWSVAALSVLAGQLYVGTGYRQMSRSFDRIVDSIIVEITEDSGPKFY
mgnify:CR=1 FL=1|tara:strand:+ start:1003 stop:1266 length:264 start_codon:yes stop_codon:yes gene_type:complete